MQSINTYDEYGLPASGNAGRFQYTGQMWLAELGVYHYKARAYHPTLGRFLQTDPIGFAGGDLNLYAYVANDPVNRSDPMGLDMTCFLAPYQPPDCNADEVSGHRGPRYDFNCMFVDCVALLDSFLRPDFDGQAWFADYTVALTPNDVIGALTGYNLCPVATVEGSFGFQIGGSFNVGSMLGISGFINQGSDNYRIGLDTAGFYTDRHYREGTGFELSFGPGQAVSIGGRIPGQATSAGTHLRSAAPDRPFVGVAAGAAGGLGLAGRLGIDVIDARKGEGCREVHRQ